MAGLNMKFKIRVDGKDSISEGLSQATVTKLEADGLSFEANRAKWERQQEIVYNKLKKFVAQFLEDGEGGNDGITVEFDTDAKTCVVVPVKKKRKR